MNCSEQISVAQRRTAALLLHARCRDVAPKDLPSARFATLEPQKLFMRMSPGNVSPNSLLKNLNKQRICSSLFFLIQAFGQVRFTSAVGWWRRFPYSEPTRS